MTSEIRANTLKNRVGLGTVSFTNTGPVVSGVTTITKGSSGGATANTDAPLILDNSSNSYIQFRTPNNKEQGLLFGDDADNDAGNIIYNHSDNKLTFATSGGTNERLRIASNGNVSIFKDLDVDGHTNLDNVSISGIVTATTIRSSNLTSGRVVFTSTGGQLEASGNLTYNGTTLVSGSPFDINADLDVDGHTNLDNVSIAGVTTFAQKINLSDNFIRNCRGFNTGNEQARIVVKAGDNSAGGGLRIVEYHNDDTTLFSSEIANFYTNGIELKEDTTVSGNLHVEEGDSGLSAANANADTVFIENGANAGITIATPNTNTGYLTFADPEDDNVGQIIYRHGGSYANSMGFFTNAGERVRIMNNGNVNIGTSELDQTVTGRLLNVYGGQIRARQTTSGNTLEAFGHTTSGQSYGLLVNAGTTANDYAATFRNSGGTTLFRVRGDGVVYVANAAPSSGEGIFNVKPSTADSYLKIRNAADFDGTLTGNVIDNRDSANGTSRDLIIRSDKLVLWQGTNEALRILDSNHIQFNGTSEEITLRTSDGSDNGYMNLSGGGACNQNRGAQLVLNGNERSSNEGLLQLLAGNSGSANSKIQMYTAGNERLVVQNGGVLSQRVNSNARFSHGILEITSSSTPSQLKIKTNIPYSGLTHAESVTIRGFRYGGRDTVDIQICWHVYAGQFYNRIASSSGGWAPTITLAVESGKVVIHFDSLGYWHKIYVADYYSAYGDYDYARGWTYDFTAINGDSGLPVNTVPYKNDWGGLTYNDSHNAAGGDLNIHDGNLIVASGHGIDFSASSHASGQTSELFDDYEEGSWTPVYSRPNMTLTMANQVGRYTKVGRVVHIVGSLNTTNEQGSSSGGPILVTGLPFTVREARTALSVRPANWSHDHPSFATFELNQTHFELLEEVEGNPSGSTDLTGTRFAGGTGNYLWFGGSYFTDT